MKRLLIFGLLALGLAGCAAGVSQEKQVMTTTNTIITQTSAASDALQTVNETTSALPSDFQRTYANSKSAITKDAKPISQLLAKRDKAYKQLTDIQAQLTQATSSLTKANNQSGSNLPQSQLTALNASLKLTQLDHKTLVSYYKEVTTAENNLFDDAQSGSTSKQINADLVSLNQYASTLGQQIDISLANLNAAHANAQKLKTALDRAN